MLKNIKMPLILLISFFLSWSCTNDEGNYNYNAINEIEVTGLLDSYTVYSGENLKITPTVHYSLDDKTVENRYTYQWVAVDPAKSTEDSKTVIATTKEFDAVVKLPPAKYYLYYLIKDNVTGITWQHPHFLLNVVTSIYEGWLVIGDVNGKARLDMVSLIPGIPQARVINDVLDASGSALKLSGKAVDVHTFYNPTSTNVLYGIYVTASESGTSRIEENTFAWNITQNIAYESVGGSFDTNFGVDFMKSPAGAQNFIYSKGNIYYFYRTYQTKYGLPQNKVAAETKPFYAAPFIAESANINGIPVFYDQEGRRFLRYSTSALTCSAMPPVTGSPTTLDWNNTNCDLIYMTTSGFNSYENFAVLKNITTGKYHLLRFTTNLAQNYYKEILNAPDFDKATKFAVSPTSGYLFYVVGGKLYEYDNGIQSAKLMLDKGVEEITYIGFHSNSKINANKLVVGSYNANSSGKLELFTVPPVNGDLILDDTYTGLCKIVDVAYRTR